MAGLNRQVRGELDHLQGLRTAQNALSFSDHSNQDEKSDLGQKTALMMATVRNTSTADRGFMSRLASCEPPGSKSFRLEIVSVPNADGAVYTAGE